MESFVVTGGSKLEGTIRVSGAKNAILPIIAATLLSDGECVLHEVPQLRDVQIACAVLEYLGATIEKENDGETLKIKADNFVDIEAPYELVRKMRASVLVMGPLLAKKGRARISLPGGCAIGSRPIDLHLKGFEALGAKVNVGHGYVEAIADKLVGNKVYLDFPSVGATENILMAACLAEGITIIENVAEEPEIVDLANFLNSMGAKIRGAGTNIIKVEGVKSLKGTVHTVIPDRIEAGTYMVAAAITKGNVLIENVIIDHLKPVVAKLKEAGVTVSEEGDGVRVFVDGNLKAVDIKTLPYPGFPTDMQAQMGALLAVATGTSVITETVFENRFMYVDELKRMGANIKLEGRCAIVKGVETLSSAPVKATDLRAGAAMLLASLIANGDTEIRNAIYIDRGYEKIEEKLNRIGAKIRRVSV